MKRTRTVVLCTLAAAALNIWSAGAVAALDKETSLVTKEKIGDLAVAGRLSVDLHAVFMASRTYGTETVLNWYNCGYSGGGKATSVGGTFGNFGLDVPYTERDNRYPHAVTIDKVPAIRFDGGDIMKCNFPVEKKIAGAQNMALEIWLRAEQPSKGDVILGWQSEDGKQTSASISYPEGFKGSDKWRHIVINCTPDKEDCYLDGVKVFSGKRSTIIKNGQIMVLGGASADKPSFKGDLVAVRLHDDTMTEEEIDHNFKGGVMLGTEMHSWWRTEPDKWYVVESEHFSHRIDKEIMKGWTDQQMNDFKKRVPGMFNLCELIYHTYTERLAMRSSVVSRRPEMRGDGIKYMTPVQPSNGSWMGVDDNFGWSCQGEGFINPHELAHGWSVMTGNMAGNFWETYANWPQTYDGYYQTIPVITAECSAFPSSGRTYYHDRLLFESIAHTPEFGPMFIAKMWYDGPTATDDAPYPWTTFDRLNPYPDHPLADEFARMAMRNVTYDYETYAIDPDGKNGNTPYGNDHVVEPESRYHKEAERSKADIQRYARILLEQIPYAPGWWRVPKEQAPQQFGWNICPLKFKQGKVSATLAGYMNPNRGGDWRAAFVGVDTDGKPVYGKIFKPGRIQSFSAGNNIKELYLVVVATPSKVMPIDMIGDFRSLDQEQFPYRVKFGGCQPLDVMIPEAPKVAGSKHTNGGGFVENTAQVAATAYVGPNAQVLGRSVVMGNARIGDYAIVKDATVRDNAIVSGHALVTDGSTIAENAKVRGYAVVKGKTTVKGNAKILEHAVMNTQKTCTDNAVVKGIASVYGGNQSGTAMIDGFYAKANEITKGKWFTWSWTFGKNPGEIDEEFGGLYADYNFEEDHGWMAKDTFGATWGYLVGSPKLTIVPQRVKKVSTLKQPEAILPKLEVMQGPGDQYVEALSGYLMPKETGDYTFWIAADDNGQLFIGDAGSTKVDRIICKSGIVGPREFKSRPIQKSALIHLESGKAYPIVALHDETTGGDHVSVAWTKPGSDKPEVITSDNLSVTPDGKQPGVRQRVWDGVSRICDLVNRPDYPSGLLQVRGQALVLDGKSQFAELPKDVADMGNCTYTAEFKWDGAGDRARIFEFANPAGSAMWLSPSVNGKLVFAIQRGNATDKITAPAVKKGVWTKVQVMIDGQHGSLFVNDKKVAENNNMSLRPDSVRATECYLGRGLKGNYFGGMIEGFTVHSVALIDSTPPAPNPPTFTLSPVFTTPDTVTMTATAGFDPLGNVEYYFEEEGGSWNSGWTKNNVVLVPGKDATKPAKYRFKMRDMGGNETQFSQSVQAAWVEPSAKVYDVVPDVPTAIEAENYAANVAADGMAWERVSNPAGYAGQGAMQLTPDKGVNIDPPKVNAPRMDYLVNFTKPGRYFVWLRGHGVNPSGDSVNMGIDLKIDGWGSGIQLGKNYAWDGRREFNIDKPGIHRFSIWMREDGAIVDRILFTTMGGYEPGSEKRAADKSLIGEGPAESSSHTVAK